VQVPGSVAITRDVGPDLAACELTHQARVPIDVELARAQHLAYQRALAEAGCRVERLPAGPGMPDAVFVEDIAIVFDELAVMTRPGAASRRAEVPEVARALERYRPLEFIGEPGTMDGGDVLVAGRRVFVGRSTRTNDTAIGQLGRMIAPCGYTVCVVAVRGCLHLKSAATLVGERLLLVNPEWVDTAQFGEVACVAVDPAEPGAANALRLADRVIVSAAFPRTADRLRAEGLSVQAIEVTELAKAEGAVTCCSLIVPDIRGRS
jgi:dimethylargininase